jgi:hypothetical protein
MPVSTTMGHISNNLIIMLHGAYNPLTYQTTLVHMFVQLLPRCRFEVSPLSLMQLYKGNSISKLQIQVATYVFELSAGNCYH